MIAIISVLLLVGALATLSLGSAVVQMPASPQVSEVASIRIDSSTTGLMFHQGTGIDIERNGSKLFSGDREVSADVAALLAALAEPTRGDADIAAFGYTPARLRGMSDQAFVTFLTTNCQWEGFYTGQQRSAYIRAFGDEKTVTDALLQYYHSTGWTDDFARVTARIHFTDDHPDVIIQSYNYKDLMLPWSIAVGTTHLSTYNAQISYALASLLPPDGANTGRLSEEKLSADLPDIVGRGISRQLESVPQFVTTPLVKSLERTYGVRIEHGGSCTTYDTYVAWNATLHWSDLPPRISAEVKLPIIQNRIRNEAAIPVARLGAEGLSRVAWLRRFLASNPQASARALIENETPVSMGEKQIKDFDDQMTSVGRGSTALALAGPLAHSFSVLVDEPAHFSHWILLPDGRMVVWLYYQPYGGQDHSVAGFSLEVLNGKVCGQYMCSGMVILPDGAIDSTI